MIDVLIALFFAHTMADYVLQTAGMVHQKKSPLVLGLHVLIVWATAAFAVGQPLAPALLYLAAAHLLIDIVKTWMMKDTLFAHLADQVLHLISVGALAWWAPGLWSTGWWSHLPEFIGAVCLYAMLLIAALIYVTRAGGFAIAKMMERWTLPQNDGLPGAGAMIGYLERMLIFVLVLAGQSGAIGFLVVAKSVLRFDTIKNNREAAEYVIIGTLFSFGWALVVALGTMSLLRLLPWPTP